MSTSRRDQTSRAACCFDASRDFRERTSVACDGFWNGLVIDELPFAPGGNEFCLAENLEMVRDSRRSDATHGDDLPTGHAIGGCRDGFKDPKARLVRQRFRYFLHFRMIHGQLRV